MSAEQGYDAPYPNRAAFAERYRQRVPQLVVRRWPGDLDTPVSAYLKLTSGRPDTFLLESVEGGESLGRYSTIGLEPDLIWRADGERAQVNTDPSADPDKFVDDDLPTRASLNRLLEASRVPLEEAEEAALPPIAAGVFGYFGYDFVRLVEHLPSRPEDPLGLPDGYFVRPTIVATFDNVRREVILVTPARPTPTLDADEAYDAACARLDAALARLAAPLSDPAPPSVPDPDFRSNTAPDQYADMVARAKEYIGAGDIFQVVLSQRFSGRYEGDPFAAYRQLRRSNPSPFLFFLNLRPAVLMGASPEILVRVRDGRVTIRPIAGTRPRGATPDQDRALEAELLADPKECAEHLMLLDLGRNDVGRASAIGSVEVTDAFFIERYSHVMHIVSNVEGDLREGLDPLDALAAGFPAGTLTGAPKIRAMQIIDELERVSRGPYGGCIGYFGTDGSVDTCIGLRMAVFHDGAVHVQAGAGIVADSDPASEQRECEIKAAALIGAVEAAARRSRRT